MKNEIYVTLERYKTDLACYKAKNDFIASKVRALVGYFSRGSDALMFDRLSYIVELLDTPASMFISDEEWKKAGSKC